MALGTRHYYVGGRGGIKKNNKPHRSNVTSGPQGALARHDATALQDIKAKKRVFTPVSIARRLHQVAPWSVVDAVYYTPPPFFILFRPK